MIPKIQYSACLFILFLWIVSPTIAENSIPLVWEDAETQQVLFTSNDIVAFDWEKQYLLLTLDATLDFYAWVPPHKKLSCQLAVKDSEGIIYEARWVSPVSSMGYPGVIYDTFLSNPFIKIENGYPGSFTDDPDLRFAERLRIGLEKAGRLRSFNPNEDFTEDRIRIQQHTWEDIGGGMKIRVECYENTFCPGQKARAHIFIASPAEPAVKVDAVETILRFAGQNGGTESKPITHTLSSEDIAKGIFVVQFDPFAPDANGVLDSHSDVCVVRFSFRLLQKSGESMTALFTSDYPPLNVPISMQDINSAVSDEAWMYQ